MSDRIARLRATLELPLLVTTPLNVRYLTGLESTNAAVLVEQERLRLFTDFRYAEKARAIPDLEVVEIARDLFREIAPHLPARIAFEDTTPYAAYAALAAGGVAAVPSRHAVERLRAVKDSAEVAAIRRAAAITNALFERLAEETFVGRTERQLAWWIERELRELGADAMAFEVHAHGGANAAAPHASLTDEPIERGTLVIVDCGAKIDGYCADCTRTFATGTLPDDLAHAYDVCLRAQTEALEAYRPGAAAREVDAVARSLIADEGLGELFGHGLGHGVGLFVHELPGVRPESDDVLEARNVISCEPGIYMPGVGGVRIEDLVHVDDGGPETLTTFTKELVTVR